MANNKQHSVFRKIINIIGMVALVFAIAAIAITLIPAARGLQATEVPTNSMVPTIKVNSIVYTNTRVSYDELEVGDIIVYKYDPVKASYYYGSEPINIIHRIIDIKPEGITVKGDNNGAPDPYLITRDMYVSRATGTILQGGATIYKAFLGIPTRIVVIAIIVLWVIFGFKTDKKKTE